MAPEAHCSSGLQNLLFKLSPSACHPPTSCPALLSPPGVISTSSPGPDLLRVSVGAALCPSHCPDGEQCEPVMFVLKALRCFSPRVLNGNSCVWEAVLIRNNFKQLASFSGPRPGKRRRGWLLLAPVRSSSTAPPASQVAYPSRVPRFYSNNSHTFI